MIIPTPRWARRLNKWNEETGPLHMLGANDKPVCGAKIRGAGGYVGLMANVPGCQACLKIADRVCHGEKVTP